MHVCVCVCVCVNPTCVGVRVCARAPPTCGFALRSLFAMTGSSAYVSALCCHAQSSAKPVVAPHPTIAVMRWLTCVFRGGMRVRARVRARVCLRVCACACAHVRV
jgi:hypothetical protein